MSFVHVLGEIGKTALHVVPFLPLPGPVGVIATVASNVISQELTSNSGEVKKENATVSIAASASVPAHPNRLQIISNLIEHIVGILNCVSQLFPEDMNVSKAKA